MEDAASTNDDPLNARIHSPEQPPSNAPLPELLGGAGLETFAELVEHRFHVAAWKG
jgi:hypothetical protein